MMIYLHGLSYSVEFSVVFLTFILGFDFLFHLLEGNLLRLSLFQHLSYLYSRAVKNGKAE